MKTVLIILFELITLIVFGQLNSALTLDFFLTKAKDMKFKTINYNSDSIIQSMYFNFDLFEPINCNSNNNIFKTYYLNGCVKLIEKFTDESQSKIEYQCFVNDFDSLKYFVFLQPIKKNTAICNHSFGVNITSKKMTLLFLTHRYLKTDTIIRMDSSQFVNYPLPEQSSSEEPFVVNDSNYIISWIIDSYISGQTVFILDSNLYPKHRFHFDAYYLIYFTNCKIEEKLITEDIFAYNPRIEMGFRKKFSISSIDIVLLDYIRKNNFFWPTYVTTQKFNLDIYLFKWEYLYSILFQKH